MTPEPGSAGTEKAVPRRKPWELVLVDSWRSAALLIYASMAVAMTAWGLGHPGDLESLVMSAENRSTSASDLAARATLLRYATVGLPFGLAGAAWAISRERRGKPRLPVHWAALAISLVGLPLTSVSTFEYQYPYFTGFVLVAIALAAGYVASRTELLGRLVARDISPRVAWIVVSAGFLLFTAWMGALSHWRFITFHAEPYDMSWETNAVHGIVHTGIPRISVGAGSFYRGQLLPANYADAHTPWIYYLYAPFYAVYQDGRTLLWLQAAAMGSGAFGMYLVARSWLRSHLLGVVFALVYVFDANVQTHCLHDVHANFIAIPVTLAALGLMEAKRPYWAVAFAFLACLCREETSVYSAATGLFWALGGSRDKQRIRIGWLTTVFATAWLLFITQFVMIQAGGQPRYSHFTFYFDKPGLPAILKSYVLNPLGALKLLSSPMRLEYIWLALVPFGFLAIVGIGAAWFVVIPMGLLFPAIGRNFWVAGMNYGAPVFIPAALMSVMGARWWIGRGRAGRSAEIASRRAGVAAFLLVTGLVSGLLYGNIFGKSYKFEFGSVPFRQSNQYDYIGELGVLRTLPPFGERERLLWDLISRVPKDGPISTSWRINPQLSNRAVSLLFPEDGSGHPPENLAKYIVIDRLPPLTYQPEEWERTLHASRKFTVFYENRAGVIFQRKGTPPPPSR